MVGRVGEISSVHVQCARKISRESDVHMKSSGLMTLYMTKGRSDVITGGKTNTKYDVCMMQWTFEGIVEVRKNTEGK
jgi:hypothetical protein